MKAYTKILAAQPSDINEHLGTLHDLVVSQGAKRVLELGVRDGVSTVALLEGVLETKGALISLDIDPCVNAQRQIKYYKLNGPWTFVQDDDIAYAKTLNPEEPFDLIFVDTSHVYEHTKAEIEVYMPLLRPGGVMAFHDTESFPKDVKKPIEEFMEAHPDYSFENDPRCNGLGIVRKPA